MKRIKKQAAKWGLAGEYFNCGDLKRHFGLDCSAATIANALKTPGEVRARQTVRLLRNLPGNASLWESRNSMS